MFSVVIYPREEHRTTRQLWIAIFALEWNPQCSTADLCLKARFDWIDAV